MTFDDFNSIDAISDHSHERFLGEENEIDHKAIVHILDKVDPAIIRELVSPYADKEDRVYVYDTTQTGSEHNIGFFGDWAPTVIAGLNSFHGYSFPFREKYIEEYSYSRLAHLMCTLDRSIMFSYENRHIASSKIRNLNACAKGLLLHERGLDYMLLREVVEERMTSKDLLFMVKQQGLELARKVRMDQHGHILKTAEPHSFKYVDKLKDMFGDNLVSVMLYGSSAVGEGKDFDNIVVLKSIPENLYEIISGKGPSFNEGGKEVGFIFINEEAAEKFFYINVSNHLFAESAKVLYGEVNLPIESMEYMVRKERYHAGFGSTKNISGINMGFKDEDLMTYLFYKELGLAKPWPQEGRDKKFLLAEPDKAGLYEYFAKLPRFTLQGLIFTKETRQIDKTYLVSILKDEFGYEVLPHRDDPSYIADRLIAAVDVSAKIIDRYYDPSQQQRKNEHIMTIEDSVSDPMGISSAHVDGKAVWVFNRRRPLFPGDNVPAQILYEGDKGYDFRMRKAAQLDKPEGILIAKRI
jgi:hypothetical protein